MADTDIASEHTAAHCEKDEQREKERGRERGLFLSCVLPHGAAWWLCGFVLGEVSQSFKLHSIISLLSVCVCVS